ncbi:MAG: ferritin [Holosporaceae bacterium]|jgi:ferritin|nr:ferritin [Holosporaceae bacterium]
MSTTLGKRSSDLLNKQINEELCFSYTYLAMSAVFREMGLDGCSRWMMLQAEESVRKAMKIYGYLQQCGAKIKFLPLTAPKQEWRAPLHIFEEFARHQQRTSSLIHAVYEVSVAEKDYQSQCFMTWFVEDQLKKENVAMRLLDKLRKMQSSDLGVIMFDADMIKREAT